MQTMFKCFEFFSSEGASLAARKIAFKIKAGEADSASQDAAAFLDYLEGLMDGSEGALKSALDQFEWVPLEGDGELPAQVVDLTGTETMPHSLMAMLLGLVESDNTATPPDDMQETPEDVISEDVLNALVPHLPGNEEPLDVTQTATDAPETGSQTTASESMDSEDAVLNPQQSDQNGDPGETNESLNEENQDTPFMFSYKEKSRFRLKFFSEKNELTEDAQAIRTEKSLEDTETDETVELQPDAKGPASGLKARAGETRIAATGTIPRGNATDIGEVRRNADGPLSEQPSKDGENAPVLAETSHRSMAAAQNVEAQRNFNGTSFPHSASQEYTEQAFSATSKDEDNQAVKSPEMNGAYQSYSRQHTFRNESDTGGQHQHQSGFMFRESAHQVETSMNGNFKEAAAVPDSVNIQSAVQDKSLQDDVIRQIVQRMSLRSDRLQSHMNIKLKPEFLGDLRLQVSTANQHVSIKMTAESASVKEMIEANIAVLKNELQQHGLHIDKFDVFVGQDSDAWKHREQQTASRQERRNRSFGSIQSAEDENESDLQDGPAIGRGARSLRQNDTGEIDFFA